MTKPPCSPTLETRPDLPNRYDLRRQCSPPSSTLASDSSSTQCSLRRAQGRPTIATLSCWFFATRFASFSDKSHARI